MKNCFPEFMKDYVEKVKIKQDLSKTKKFRSDYRYTTKILQHTPIPYNMFQEHAEETPPCTRIHGVCECCVQEFVIQYKMLKRRTRCDIIKHQICNNCILKYVTSTNEWRKNNSDAQKIAQNRPETLEKMRKSVKASKTPEVLKKHSLASKKMWTNEKYRNRHREGMKKAFENMSDESYEKMTHKNRFYSGWYHSKFGKIYFNSSWELAFIVWCENNKSVLSLIRCKDKIKYKDVDGKNRIYMPDFEVTTEQDVYIIEIKGQYNLRNVEEKKKSSDKIYQGEKHYCLWYKHDLINRGIISNHFNPQKFCELLSSKIEGLYKNGTVKK